MTKKVKIQIIIGSVREGRKGPVVADWLLGQIKDFPGMDFEIVDLADWDLPMAGERGLPIAKKYEREATKRWAQKIDSADGYIWLVTEYNHGYSPVLKNAIDTLYHEWSRKPVAFVGYGVLGAQYAISQLTVVAAELGMVPLTYAAVHLIDAWENITPKGVNPKAVKGDTNYLAEVLKKWATELNTLRM